MKKVFITVLLVLTTLLTFSQARLNTTEAALRVEFGDVFSSGYTTPDNIYYLAMSIDNAVVMYYFDDNRVCYCTVIVPNNNPALSYYIEKYNNNYVIISPTKWRRYDQNGIYVVELLYTKDGGYLLIWTNL